MSETISFWKFLATKKEPFDFFYSSIKNFSFFARVLDVDCSIFPIKISLFIGY